MLSMWWWISPLPLTEYWSCFISAWYLFTMCAKCCCRDPMGNIKNGLEMKHYLLYYYFFYTVFIILYNISPDSWLCSQWHFWFYLNNFTNTKADDPYSTCAVWFVEKWKLKAIYNSNIYHQPPRDLGLSPKQAAGSNDSWDGSYAWWVIRQGLWPISNIFSFFFSLFPLCIFSKTNCPFLTKFGKLLRNAEDFIEI